MHVLLVSRRDVCRSAIAGALLTRLLEDAAGTHAVERAGTSVVPGSAVTPHAAQACAAVGADDVAGGPTQLTAARLLAADVAVCMTRAELDVCRGLAPEVERVLLAEDDPDVPGGEIADPSGGDVEEHRQTRETIARALDRFAAARGLVRYQPYWCEENVWHLLASENERTSSPRESHAVFVSNPTRSVAMWGQRAALVEGTPVVWDYHVFALVRGDAGYEVRDLDSTVGRRMPVGRWLSSSFPVTQDLPQELWPLFRVVEGELFLSLFSSDRSHMLDPSGELLRRAPPWPAIRGSSGTNLRRFIEMEEPFAGEVLDLEGFARRFAPRLEGPPTRAGEDMSGQENDIEVIHAGRIVNLRRARVSLPGGKETTLELMSHPGAAAVVPLDGDDVILIRQYRHSALGWLWEIPAGTLEEGEAPGECARRELEEEAGVRAEAWQELGFIFTAPGFLNEKIHIYLAQELSDVPTRRDADEVIEEVRRVPLEEALAMIDRGEITDAKTTVGLLRVARLRSSASSTS